MTAAGPVYYTAQYACVHTTIKSLVAVYASKWQFSYTSKYITMRICVTCASDDPVIDDIYLYCQRHSIGMYCGTLITLNESYWLWRIEQEPTPALTWLLLQWGDYLVEF